MPSTMTTGVTIGTILDLIGPAGQNPSAGRDQLLFDALLQPPLPTASRPDPFAQNERSAAAMSRREDEPSGSGSLRSPPPSAQSADGVAGSADNESQPDTAPDTSNPRNDATRESDGPSVSEPETSQAADELLVESLAGLVGVAPPIIAPDSSVEVVQAGESTVEEPIEAGIAATATTKAQSRISKARDSSTAPLTGVPDAELPSQAIDNSLPHAEVPSTETNAAHQHAAGKLDTLAASDVVNADAEIAVQPSDAAPTDAGQLDRATTDASNETTTSSNDQQQRETSQRADVPLVESTADSNKSSPTVPLAPDATNLPAASQPASQLPVADSPQRAAGTSPANSAAAASPPSRSRLPADVLAQPASGSNRRLSTAIDTTRLLSRVARAFAAAQERDGEIRLRLSPPELGSLRLDVRIQDGALVAHLQTETDAARTAILENLPALRDRLFEQGVRIERFDVDLMQRQAGGMPDQPGGQQQEAPAAPLRVTPVARTRPEAHAASINPSPTVGAADGLNVIV